MKTHIENIVSIITIVFNGEQHIEQTILSVLNQKNIELEYIVIDGGSKDNTLKILEKYKNKIDILISEPDNGIYNAINKGIKLAKGSLIGLIHCGDFYEPDVLSVVYKEFQKTSADVIYGDIINIEHYLDQTITHRRIANHSLLKKKMTIFHPATFFSHECYLKNGLYDECYEITADYDFVLKLYLKNVHFQYIPKVLANFIVGGISGSRIELLVKENFQIRKNRLGTIRALIYIIKTIPIITFYNIRHYLIQLFIGKQNFIKLRLYVLRKRILIKTRN